MGALGLLPLGYIGNALVVVAVIYQICKKAVSSRFGKAEVWTLGLIGVAALIGVATGQKIEAIAFGVYIITPLILGVFVSREMIATANSLRRFCFAVWACSLIGVTWDYFSPAPWAGFSFDVGSIQVAASREWSFEGARRVAGFAKTSFDAGGFLLIGAIGTISLRRPSIWNCLVWVLTFIGLSFTTTKGLLLVFFVNTLIWFLSRTKLRGWLKLLPWGATIITICLPLSTFVYQFTMVKNDGVMASLFSSFFVRLTSTWPDAWDLLASNGSSVFGTGIGGIGTPLMMFDPMGYNSADNLFVYLFFLFGVFSFILLYVFCIQSSRDASKVGKYSIPTFRFQVAITTLVYGMTTNVVELGALCLFLGVLFEQYVSFGQITLRSGGFSTRIGKINA
jgi:hypothetical protein